MKLATFGFLVLGAALAACSSSKDTSTTAGSGGAAATSTSSGAGGDPTPTTSCVQKGGKGNTQGVGEYCTPHGGECAAFPLSGSCLASLPGAQDQWFCTRIGCNDDADCGDAATCVMQQGSSACVPNHCLDGAGGAGGSGGGSTSTGVGGGAGGK